MSVVDLIVNGAWIWPYTWLLKAPNLGLIPSPHIDTAHQYCMRLCDSNGNMSNFSVKCAWEVLRAKGNEVLWYRKV